MNELSLQRRKLLFYLGLGAASTLCMGVLTACVPVESVQLKTPDGWIIVGDRYMPSGVAKGAVVLLHQRGGSAQDWQALSTALQKAGFIALAIDQRGAGRSTQGPGPKGDDAPWATSAA
jgi:predicted alpha/beta hydrolase